MLLTAIIYNIGESFLQNALVPLSTLIPPTVLALFTLQSLAFASSFFFFSGFEIYIYICQWRDLGIVNEGLEIVTVN